MCRAYEPAIDLAKAMGDAHRGDIVRSLAADSYSAGELAYALDLAQPALSHHLKRLTESGIVDRRREGNTIYYSRAFAASDELLTAFFQALDQHPIPAPLARRFDTVHSQRAEKSRAFFAANSERFVDQRDLIANPTVYVPLAEEVLGEIARSIGDLERPIRNDAKPAKPIRKTAFVRALEVGPGDGDFLRSLGDIAQSVVAIDEAQPMLTRAAERAARDDLCNIEFIARDLATHAHHESSTYDLVVASMVLHHAPSPAQFLTDCARLLKPGAVLLLIELCSHEQDWVAEACGDIWHGFEPRQLDYWSASAGLSTALDRYVTLNNGFRIQIRTYLKEIA